MYASIRQYRVIDDPSEAVQRISEGFVPIVREVPGFSAWYLLVSDDGSITTVTVCDDRAGVEASVSRASSWVLKNLGDVIQGPPSVVNGEVKADARRGDERP
jgi:hypothetical protein